MTIYLSGLYSGTNPQPGVGLARSLRQAYPEAMLIGVEYSARCSGIHWHELDDVWLQRSWKELNLDRHADAIRRLLDKGCFYISANDLEILWLSEAFPEGHPHLLTPPQKALQQVGKPAVPAHSGLPVKIPTFVTTQCSDWELHAFCRRHDWKVWLKGPYYEAIKIRSWTELDATRRKLSRAWHTDTLFLQAHVTGYEESIALSAYKGELLHCVSMRKRDLTEIAKTWAGDVGEVGEELQSPLRKIIRDIGWTGGAELEMLRDADGQLHLLEWNPRYPAWIHGATIAGHNMAAILVESATGVPFLQSPDSTHTPEFTRVVLEIPVKSSMPLPPLPEPYAGGIGHSLKHPSGLVEFAEKLREQKADIDETLKSATGKPPEVPPSFIKDIISCNPKTAQTPSFIFLESTATAVLQAATRAAQSASIDGIVVHNAYSIKTNPDARMLHSARAAGFLAEAISPLEVSAALDAGFTAAQIILNGPGKWWQPEHLPAESLHAVFCDSVADMKRVGAALYAGSLKARIAGIRLRTPQVRSRFGVPIDSPADFEEAIKTLEALPRDVAFGVHFHMASSSIGVQAWTNLFESMLRWCVAIEKFSGRQVTCLDMGGGWAPDDWEAAMREGRLTEAVRLAREHLPSIQEIISELGKAVAQPSMALAMRILEVSAPRADDEGRQEIIVDGSVAELPMYFVHPHRILHQSAAGGPLQPLGRGKTQLFGRLCMEHDIVAANVALPQGAKAGDLLVFCDAGAYDKSMSYVFGHG